jgi:predicted N-acetyltransferase YhbS
MKMNIRPITASDTENCGQIIYKAFSEIADRHNFPRDFPSVGAVLQMTAVSVANPHILGFVAEDGNGKFLGSNFLWRQNSVAGVGPVTVDPDEQAKGVGRSLMLAVIEAGRDASGIRLVQDAYNTASLALYADLGFDVVEPLAVMHGVPAGDETASPETEVRPLAEKDYEACGALCRTVHGFDRTTELAQTAQMFPAFVAERGGRVVAYAAAPVFWNMNHAVAETVADMQNLLAGAARLSGQPLSFLLPTRQAELFRWCLAQKLRVVKPMTLMALGDYQEPRGGCFLPSGWY